jgi:hypothetical protein
VKITPLLRDRDRMTPDTRDRASASNAARIAAYFRADMTGPGR